MGLFSKKPEHAASQVDALTRVAQKKILRKAEEAIGKSYKDHRLIFNDKGARYTDKLGRCKDYSLDDLASVFWVKLDNELMSQSMGGQTASMAMLGITMEDIRNIILKLKETK